PGLLADLDVAAAPYPQPSDGGHYFSPLKVYEYLAAGLAVVASEVGELPGLLAGGVGLGVRPGDVGDLAAALERLAADPGLRARLGAAGRRAAVSEHSWQQRSEVLLEALGLPTGTPAGAATV